MNRFLLQSAAGTLVALVLIGAPIQPAQGQTLYGETVTAEWLYPTFDQNIESHDVVVGPAIELPSNVIINDTAFDIDIGESSVRFEFNEGTLWSPDPFNGWRFTDTNGTIPPIAAYRIASVSNGVTGLDPSDLGWTSEAAWANFGGVEIAGSGDFIVLELVFGVFFDGFESGDTSAWSSAVQ